MCLDLDGFKNVNDTLGHATGDALLVEVSRRIKEAVGRSNVVARLGGDEFAVLLRSVREEAEIGTTAQRIVEAMRLPCEVMGAAVPVRVSIGIARFPKDGTTVDEMMQNGDLALYDAKAHATGSMRFFVARLGEQVRRRLVLERDLREAMEKNQLELHYQPKVSLNDWEVIGFEALLRWNHPERGIVPPSQFLPLIEHTGLSPRVGDHVLARALDQLEAWLEMGLDLSVSVNITARHLQEPDFAQRLSELLARHRRPLGPRLELEVLETAALADIDISSAVLQRCAQLGVRWSLDDFGTGYSTLTYLKRLPVQALKIDRSFVHNMLNDAQDRAIVENVISLSRTFDCQVIAEGVEGPAQARLLLELGCAVGQGMGIAAPMPAEAVPAWVRGWRGLFALVPAPLPAAADGAEGAEGDGGGIVVDHLPPPRGHAGD
jgi:diguanylate cyclase (GGDEF)-like protein